MADQNNLVVLMFEGEHTAAAVYAQVEQLAKEKLLKLQDAIIIERSGGDGASSTGPIAATTSSGGVPAVVGATESAVHVKQMKGKKGSYAAKGAGIGLLAGVLLGGPIGGLVAGAGIGAITAALKDLGIDDHNIDAIKARLQPNSSALLLLGTAKDREALITRLRSYDPKVISTSLPPEVEQQFRAQLER